MRFRRTLSLSCLVAFLSSFSASTLFATETVSSGQKVRVEYRPNSSVQGTLVSSSADSIVVNREGTAGAITIPSHSIERVQRYDGKKRNWAWGLLIGTVAGTAVGWMVGANEVESNQDAWPEKAYIAGLGITGALLGTALGACTKSDRWETVPIESLSISIGASHDVEVALALSVHF